MSSRAKSATRVKRKTTPNSYRAGMNKPNLNSSISHNGSQTESNSTPNNCRGRTRARGNHALSNRSSETRTNHQSTLSNSRGPTGVTSHSTLNSEARNNHGARRNGSVSSGVRSQHWESDHRTWQQRGGYRGYRIPDDRFRGHFGPEHGFRVHGLPFLVVGGYPRFQYGGYWVSAVDPWPEYWGDNWYDNDDVYVTYVDNGYYLYNRRYPNAGIAISISF